MKFINHHLLAPLLFLLAASTFCKAQTYVQLGLHGGATNFSGFGSSRLGGRAGLSLGHGWTDRLATDVSVGYWSLGNRSVTDETGGAHDMTTTTVTTRMHSTDIALVVRYRPWEKVEFAIAPSLTILHRATDHTEIAYTDSTSTGRFSYTEDHTGFYQQLDWGVRPSVAYHLRDGLSVRLTVHQGLGNLSALDFLGVKQRSQALLIGVEWRLWEKK